MTITSEKFIRNTEILSTEMDGEVVMMDAEAGSYFNLSKGVGASIWSALENSASLDEIVSAVCSEYEIAREDCIDDVTSFMDQLQQHKLILPVKGN
jgi:hypothetical protein